MLELTFISNLIHSAPSIPPSRTRPFRPLSLSMALGHLWLSYSQGMVAFSLEKRHSPQGAGEHGAGGRAGSLWRGAELNRTLNTPSSISFSLLCFPLSHTQAAASCPHFPEASRSLSPTPHPRTTDTCGRTGTLRPLENTLLAQGLPERQGPDQMPPLRVAPPPDMQGCRRENKNKWDLTRRTSFLHGKGNHKRWKNNRRQK